MKFLKQFSAVAFLMMTTGSLFAQYTVKDIQNYIESYKELAINKMYEYKIPASITMAQGIFESAAGTSRLAVQGNNHFGIKCHNDWTGDTILIDDDELQECFRNYKTVEESYNDHSLFLKNRKRYSALFELNVMDYVGWAHGLKAAGYATNPEYAPRLISIIEKYGLADLDTMYQQRLASGYFQNYPNVNPASLTVSAKPQTSAPQPKPVVADKPVKPKTESQKARQTEADKPKENQKPAKTEPKPAEQAPTAKPTATKPASPAPQTTPTTPAPNTDSQPAPAKPSTAEDENAASEVAGPEDKPTAITVFSARNDEYPQGEYPFTERKVYVNNKTLFVIAQKGDNYSKIAKDVQTSEKKLKKYNDVTGSAKLKVGQVVYIEHKSKVGQREYYKVVNAESLNYIAQKTGVQLDRICKYNGFKSNVKLKKGDVIKLKK